MNNHEISDVFSLLSKLMDIHNENNFKAKSYANVAFSIDKLPIQLSETSREQIQYLKGIGESAAKKIDELLDTGTLKQLDELIGKTPEGILELMKIKGIGPKKVAMLWHELGIESPGELLYACNENRLVKYKGFGEKSQESIKASLEFYFQNQGYYLYAQLEPIAKLVEATLEQFLEQEKIQIAGAFSRQEDFSSELVWVLNTSFDTVKTIFSSHLNFEYVTVANQEIHYHFQSALLIKFVCVEKSCFGSTSFIYRSSQEFAQSFQNEYKLDFRKDFFEKEEEIFEKTNHVYLPPYSRMNKYEPSIFSNINWNEIIETKDIKGAIHNHSLWSDGRNSIEEMALACIERGYEYLVMSDHSVSSFYANGLSVERIREQHREIDMLNIKLAPFKIFKSIECDILNDGSLDYSDTILAQFDLVIASVHQNLNMSEEKAMERILNAITNPYTTILGHPTGRLLLSRKGYPIDHKKIIEACKANHVVIEINANPRRLDMDWSWIHTAQENGVLLSINPDAHSVNGLGDIHYGVMSAQKGFLNRKNNLSSFSLPELEKYLEEIKRK